MPAVSSAPPVVSETKAADPAWVRLNELDRREVDWLWPGRIPLGKLTLLAGDPGLGKSLLTLDLAARISRGAAWPCAEKSVAPTGSVILLSAEDDLRDTVRPRLETAEADLDRIIALTATRTTPAGLKVPLSLRRDLDAVRAAFEAHPDCRLLVIDPISAYLDHSIGNSHSDIRTVLFPLGELAAENRVAILAVTHLNKRGSGRALLGALCSAAFIAAVRAAWGVIRDPEDKARRLFMPLKNNLAPEAAGLAYRVACESTPEVPTIQWESDTVTQSIADMLGTDAIAIKQRDERDETYYIHEWLCEQLSHGPIIRSDLFRALRRTSISEKQLYRAAEKLGVIKTKEGYCPDSWVWSLPEEV